ncbi:dihydrolipoamide acetyltransferase family protein [Leucobacter denitrificans]|uniref:Dihydrolipoamide acetyltransferase component of pyruvate dehydrogenase complex n=1 Tax=Leucobacter denitrificans TaxID=683042 RepID=A0A7G9S2Z1_9MICO|nr:dihydrolipoamide acetyltransferase family protein [Leucobacter denitrificans]QNN62216.1 2-oxo acid dehydrogenase subunit E2 [Leucobacter denitrificans]
MSDMTFPLPDVGEGLTEAEIVAWKVKPGDEVTLNQVICEIETAKSIVELPSPFAGTVTELLAEAGETVPVGSPILKVSTAGGGSPTAPAGDASAAAVEAGDAAQTSAETKPVQGAEPQAAEPAEQADEAGSVLVGYGLAGKVNSRRRSGGEPLLNAHPIPVAEAAPVIAKPPIRKLAKDLGVDLALVQGTGIGGEILRDDVVRHGSQVSVFRNITTPEPPEQREERIPLKGIRKLTAQAMVASSNEAPHVGVFVEVDATRTMEFVKRLKTSTDFAGVKVSPLLIFAKAMLWAIRRNPEINSTFTETEIIRRHYVNLGIAAATPRGLLVPNIKEAQDLSLLDLAKAIEQLTITARDGRTPPADMQNGTITITNIGVFGMDFGTPILNPGEVAIMAMGTIRQKPWVVDGEVRPRMVTTVGGSFDHRVVDGDVVSRFVADVASVLEEPALLLD